MADVEEENSVVRSEAEVISSEDETTVRAKRRRIEEPEEQSNEDEILYVRQPAKEEEKNCEGSSTQVILDRNQIKLRAIRDFDPTQMNEREKRELGVILVRIGLAYLDSPENHQSGDELDLNSFALPFKRGDIMETISSENSRDMDGWLLVRHLDSGKNGFILRNRVVMETDHQPSRTTLYDLPLEMLDIILQQSYLHWILNLSTKQRDKEVIRSLKSVDVCFYQRITRQWFKKAICRHLKDFYGKTKKRLVIIRNNRNYLLENIQPNDELIDSLLSLNCITEEQSHFIQRHRLNRDKTDELLYVVESFDETNFSNFVKCLRQTNQKTVARTIENGGALIKIDVQTCGAKCTTSMETELLHKKIEDLRNRTTPRSHEAEKLISQLGKEGIEILNSQLDRQTVVVWIWCHSQAALEHIQKLYELNQLRDVFFEYIQPSISKVINIDGNQFKNTIVACPISIDFTQRIEIGGNGFVRGVTKLRSEIYVLCRSLSSYIYGICVFKDRIPFHLQKTIEMKEITDPRDIGSSDKGNCLYVSDAVEKCVWKITRETDDQHRIIKWLTTDYHPFTLSMPSDGRLLVVNQESTSLMIYGSDAELIRSIQLHRDMKVVYHAVETSIGNFIILHEWYEVEKGESEAGGRKSDFKYDICELTRDGQMVIRRFIPSNETQQLYSPRYLSLDSDDRVFVADFVNRRVILLNSDLKWNRILCPTKEETEENKNIKPFRLCYDEEKKQLIVGRYFDVGVHVYTLSQN